MHTDGKTLGLPALAVRKSHVGGKDGEGRVGDWGVGRGVGVCGWCVWAGRVVVEWVWRAGGGVAARWWSVVGHGLEKTVAPWERVGRSTGGPGWRVGECVPVWGGVYGLGFGF